MMQKSMLIAKFGMKTTTLKIYQPSITNLCIAREPRKLNPVWRVWMRVCVRTGSNRFLGETNWCSYSYILYNVYQTKTNTASNLKRIKRKKEKTENWAIRWLDEQWVLKPGEGGGGHCRCCRHPVTAHPSSWQQAEGCGGGRRGREASLEKSREEIQVEMKTATSLLAVYFIFHYFIFFVVVFFPLISNTKNMF